MKAMLVGITASAFAVTATAAEPHTGYDVVKASFNQLDANQSDTLSRDELVSFRIMMRAFATADVDADGVLSDEEFRELLRLIRKNRGKAPAPTD